MGGGYINLVYSQNMLISDLVSVWDQATSAVICLRGSSEYLMFPTSYLLAFYEKTSWEMRNQIHACDSGNLSTRNTPKRPYLKGDQKKTSACFGFGFLYSLSWLIWVRLTCQKKYMLYQNMFYNIHLFFLHLLV